MGDGEVSKKKSSIYILLFLKQLMNHEEKIKYWRLEMMGKKITKAGNDENQQRRKSVFFIGGGGWIEGTC